MDEFWMRMGALVDWGVQPWAVPAQLLEGMRTTGVGAVERLRCALGVAAGRALRARASSQAERIAGT
jgi:hypothetical protein